MALLLAVCFIPEPSNAIPCKTRIIYKTVHVPVHVIKKVPVIKEVKVPVYVKEKHHHKGHHEGMHHEGMHHKMGGMHNEHGFGGF